MPDTTPAGPAAAPPVSPGAPATGAPLRLTLTPREDKPGDLQVLELSDADLTAGLTHEVGEKHGSAFIPAIFDPPHRSNANVRVLTALVLDFDKTEEGALELLLEKLRAKGVPGSSAAAGPAGLKFWWFHTYNYPRARVLIPFAEPFPITKPEDWSRRAWPALVSYLGLEGAVQCDEACKDPARLYFEPRKSPGAPHRSEFNPGAPLDWRTIPGVLNAGPRSSQGPEKTPGGNKSVQGPPSGAVSFPPGGAEDPSRPVDLDALRKKLLGSSTECVRNLARGKAVSLPPGKRPASGLPRHMAWFYGLGALSMAAEPWMASEALLELCRPSWNAEAMEGGGDETPWVDVESMLAQQRISAPKKRAEFLAARASAKSAWERTLRTRLGPPEPSPGPAAVDGEDDEDGPPEGDGGAEPPGVPGSLGPAELFARLQLNPPPKGAPPDAEPTLKRSRHNLSVLLRESYIWRGALRKNRISDMTEIHGGPLFDGTVRPFTDTDVKSVMHWFVAQFDVEFSLLDVDTYVELAAADFAYDPLTDYLKGLKWDGKARLDGMLEDYFRVLPGEEGPPAAHVRSVSSKWMIGAAARALRPGCQLDTALVLHESTGGKRKSTAARVLGGALFSVFDYNLESDDAKAACSENWILEMGELSSMSKARREHVKMFLTKTSDKFRPKYGRRQIDHPRRCAFIGTTNDLEIFDGDDPAMERRFWPVTVGNIDVDALKRDRDQLWAEAVARLEAGEQWYMSDEQEALAKAETAKRVRPDDIAEQIEDWYAGKAPEKRAAALRVMDVGRTVLRMDKPMDRALQMRVAASLRSMGFGKRRALVDGMNAQWWFAPPRLLVGPKREGGAGPGPPFFPGATSPIASA